MQSIQAHARTNKPRKGWFINPSSRRQSKQVTTSKYNKMQANTRKYKEMQANTNKCKYM